MNAFVISPIKLSIIKCEVRVKERGRQRIPEGEAAVARRRRALKRLDNELEKGNFKAALSLVKQLQRNPGRGGLRGFGIADKEKLVSKSSSSFDEIKLNGGMESSLHVVIDLILRSVKCCQKFQMLDVETDEVPVQNSGEDLAGKSFKSLYKNHVMCMQHEAGHFLIGYMLGVLPKRYQVPSMEDLLQDEFAGGNVEFIGFEFLRDVGSYTMSNKKFTGGKLSKKVRFSKKELKRFLCATLGGLAAEHLSFGCSELLYSDVEKLNRVLKKLGFTENEIDSEVRRALEDTVCILGRHTEARCELAEAMALGRSVGFCIDTIESNIKL